MVNFVRGHPLNPRQFQDFLEEINSDFCDLPYCTTVKWLSIGKVMLGFYKLRREIHIYLNEMDRADVILSKLSFLIDITLMN